MIRKVLIANRGEIAVRVCHTLREMGIRSVAVFTEPDAKALHVRVADEARPVESYLDAAGIVKTAKESGAEAIHPGYGFLSENPILAVECERAGIIFIGPRPETIRVMGDKLESKRLMQEAGVPVVPKWDANPPEAEYPVLVKAVGGGGGKGMRVVEDPAALADAMASASRIAAAAFGNDRVFIEKYIPQPRHVEFQILGDSRGNVIHLFERECSIQRRHQKIIEETPSTALTPELRSAMGTAAVAAARAVNYLGAGTVEFILDQSGQFYFLEMNTRLQVEHPVTEMTTGMDLVREQVLVADGAELSRRQSDAKQAGHSIECRIYAEVPEEHFRPSTGTIEVFEPPMGPGIRLDSGISRGSVVSYHFDPLLAKLIVWADSRDIAIERMNRALGHFVLGGVGNNIQFLKRIISSDDFRAGRIDTGFIDRHPELFLGEMAAAVSARRPMDPWAAGAWRQSSMSAAVSKVRSETRHVSRTSSTSATGDVIAPMPGKLLRVEVSIGDTVTERQTVAVMESMKMETPLQAPRSGRVSQVRRKAGEPVNMGELLIVID